MQCAFNAPDLDRGEQGTELGAGLGGDGGGARPVVGLGLVLAFGALIAMINLEGATVGSLLLPAPMVLVFGVGLGWL